jgi:hypothetical protein
VPEADYLKAIELARLQGRACVPRPAMLCSALDGDLLGPIYGWFTEVHYTRSQVYLVEEFASSVFSQQLERRWVA